VHDIQVFTTTILAVDNKRVIAPNAGLTGDLIANYSAEGTRRVDLVVGVSYSDNLDR
jgi:small conductance mechanosensitive channel